MVHNSHIFCFWALERRGDIVPQIFICYVSLGLTRKHSLQVKFLADTSQELQQHPLLLQLYRPGNY